MSGEQALRVAFVTVGDTSRLTGGYLYNARVLDGIRERGVEVEEIVASGASPEEQEEAARRAGPLLDPDSFDVIVVDALARIVVAPYLDRWRMETPVVAMVHELPSVAGGGSQEQVARERRREAPILRSDLLVTVSAHGQAILESRSVPTDRIHIVPPGFDRLSSSRITSDIRGDGTVRVLCVAQWIPRKGILTLVEAWGSRERPGAELCFVGETDADPAYAAVVREAVSRSRASITVSGAVSDAALREAYATADLFVLTSRYEGYGMVYAEALSHGLPVVASGTGPVPDLLGPDAALLVAPDAAWALSNALDLLVGDSELRARMASAARRRAEELPRWRDTVDGFHRVLRAAASRRSGSPVETGLS